MPEITTIHIGLLALAAVVGTIVGWVFRGKRSTEEKSAVNSGWQTQIEAQRTEHERLLDQNKNLMAQVSQFQASGKDATNRARELSDALKETFERRDELQRDLKDARSKLESTNAERDRLQKDKAKGDDAVDALKQKDEKIFKLSRELDNWQDRLPPLIDRYRERDEEARDLERQLAEAEEKIASLESTYDPAETRVDPLDQDSLTNGLDASNETIESTSLSEAVEEDDESKMDAASAIADVFEGAFRDVAGNDNDDSVNVSDDKPIEAPPGIAAEAETVSTSDESGVFGNSRDDLKEIKGVGPAIEKTLNELGIFRFEQIAGMSEYDIDRVAQRLKGFRSRIYREDWIGQARDLRDEHAGTETG